MASDIPVEVRQFVQDHIRALYELEILLLVSALPDREWSADAVQEVVRSNPAVVAERLEAFVKSGFLSKSGDPPLYRYAPKTEELGQQISALGAIYRMSRHRIVELIYSKPVDPMLGFSDAFKFKPKK